MLAAVNSKKGRYEPVKYMMNAKALARQAEEARAEREPMTGDEILRRMRQIGVRIVDLRADKTEVIQEWAQLRAAG